MTLNQLQTYIVGVLQGYFPNKTVLDKLTESADGTLLFNGQQISGETLVTDAELQQAIEDTLAELGITDDDLEEISANVSTLVALQTAIANGANVITVTEPLTISSDVTLESETPIKIITNDVTDVFTVDANGTLTLGKNVKISSNDSVLYANGGIVNIDGAEIVSASPTNALAYVDANGAININAGKVVGTTYNAATFSVDEGNIVVNDGYVGSEVSSVLVAKNKGVVTVNGGIVETKAKNMSAAYSKTNGTINVTGGELINNGTAGDSYTLIAATDGIVNMSGGSVDNGVLAHESAKAKATISGNAKVAGNVSTNHDATLVVTGGTFETDPSEYVPDGYTVLNSNDSYSVIKNV